ncbi:MAG: hypothetical protein A3G91_01490 [Omnitrophica WOR_2 bacterium RIFCSPLOWO2_12_FULL_50_9]|nr:MAG: hypothetical protein A3D87_03040 [Omnitrophica WOR_2 bacterium RIFCSPHIGHO2_02_FULL_50_17]OGX41824.1 MAG: hypothetical protein A3G91_01490 [Omnitrophica WOR_2 bacterium RIFCSPLOWO2_12_FULL_50_9]
MKELLHKKRSDLHKGLKLITISAHTEDPDSRTRVRKSFLYNVSRTETVDIPVAPPQIYIRKHFDTEHKIEKFTFQVKGIFYTANGEWMAKVYFHHCLNVQISWKKSFLPQQVSGSD